MSKRILLALTVLSFVACSGNRQDCYVHTLDTLTHLTVIEGYAGTCPVLPFVGKPGNSHCLEIPLYYRSLRQNISLRLKK